MDVQIGYQNRDLLEILKNPKKYSLFFKEYVEVGKYYEQIKAFQVVFPEENIKIYDFDNLKDSPSSMLEDIDMFLGVEKYDYDISKRYNTFIAPKNKQLIYLIKNHLFFRVFNFITPFFIKEAVKRLLMDAEAKKPQMDKEKFF